MPYPRRRFIAATLALILFPCLSKAQEEDESAGKPMRDMSPEERRAAFEVMSEEEKEALREKRRAAMEKRRAEWQAMSPEERQAKREEMRERMRNMTPEERAAIRERMKRARMHATKPDEPEQKPVDPGSQ